MSDEFDISDLFKGAKREATAEVRAGAMQIHDLFAALVEQGFERNEALAIVLAMVPRSGGGE